MKIFVFFLAVIIAGVMIAGCTMSDEDVQNYIDTHPEEISQYVNSHGQMISEYLAEHPEILEQITLPETQVPVESTTMVSSTSEPTPTETTVEPTAESTTTTPTPTPTVAQTTVVTTVPTTEATTIPTTIPTTVPTTLPRTQIPDNTPVPTTLVTIVPTATPTPLVYTVDPRTGLPALASIRSSWLGSSTDVRIKRVSLTCNPVGGIITNLKSECRLEGSATETYRQDFFSYGNNALPFDFFFTVIDGKNGIFTTNEPLADPIYQNRTEIRDLVYSSDVDTVRISGIDYLTFRRV